MYLRGLSGQRVPMGTAPAAMYFGADNDPSFRTAQAQCAARGGMLTRVPANYQPGTAQIANAMDNLVCILPDPVQTAAPAPQTPINNTVSVNTATQVSPQISPSFVQQDHPTNSPVSTRADQTGAPAVQDLTTTAAPAPDTTAADFAAMVRAFQNALPVAQLPAAQPVASTVPGVTDAGQSVILPTPFGPSTIPVDTVSKYAPWVAAGLIGLALMYSRKGR